MAIVIAIDGPSSVGKTTVASGLACKLRCKHVSSGAMYRAIAWRAVCLAIDISDEDALLAMATGMNLDFAPASGLSHKLGVIVDGEDITDQIRMPEVTHVTSLISHLPAIRELVRSWQLDAASRCRKYVIVEGRDIGTTVFPQADVKVFLTADREERARRRACELEALGCRADDIKVIEEQDRLDYLGYQRASSPFTVAKDAIVLDTTGLTPDAVIDQILELTKNAVHGFPSGCASD